MMRVGVVLELTAQFALTASPTAASLIYAVAGSDLPGHADLMLLHQYTSTIPTYWEYRVLKHV